MNINNLTAEQLQEQIKKFEQEDRDFHKQHANVFFKTTYKTYGGEKKVRKNYSYKIKITQNINHTLKQLILVDVPKEFGHDGRFTDHLLHATMYRNHSLNTTSDKERWMRGAKDWMEHLN